MSDLDTCWSLPFSLETTVFLVTKYIPRTRNKAFSEEHSTCGFPIRAPLPLNPLSTSAEDSQLVLVFVSSALFSHTTLIPPPWRHFPFQSLNHCLICCSSHLKTSCRALHIETSSCGNQQQDQKAHGARGCHNACNSEPEISILSFPILKDQIQTQRESEMPCISTEVKILCSLHQTKTLRTYKYFTYFSKWSLMADR